jgi:predicted ATP-dependent endonuclease of OLD family
MNQRLHKSCVEIQKKNRTLSLKKILENILDEDIINELFKKEEIDEVEKMVFQYNNLSGICNKISAGQSTLLYLFCNIVSHIRYDSLLLFDEPETHLHPNAITALMSAINELLEEYQSYSIISTQSPLIVRELLSRSVYVMERKANYPSIKKIGLESFGENLTVLTEEIFGNKEVTKFYKKKIKEMIQLGYNYEDIVKLIETKDIPLSLNLTIFIKSLIEQI